MFDLCLINDDIDYLIFKKVSVLKFSEINMEFNNKLNVSNEIREILRNNDCTYFCTYKNKRFVTSLCYTDRGTTYILYF
jgi:hypothetical protein